jgi:hypothetical protein
MIWLSRRKVSGVATRDSLDRTGGPSERLGSTTGSSTTWYAQGWG